jgi:hypothetical protein
VDTAYDSAVLVSDLRIDEASPCDDDRLAELHGTPGQPAADRLDGLDQHFDGLSGARFQNLVEVVAAEAGVDPGLLAVNALTEQPTPSYWLTAGPVRAEDAGLGDWSAEAPEILGAVPGAPSIGPGPSPQELANGRDALRAMAWTLRDADVRLAQEVGSAYGDLPANQRYVLQRLAFDRGVDVAVAQGQEAASSGTSVVVASGDVAADPQRAATVRGAQAVHVAYSMFGQGVGCEP